MTKFERTTAMTEEEFERQYVEATRRGELWLRDAVKAVAARYDDTSRRVVLDLQNGLTLLVPVDVVQGLHGASDTALRDFSLILEGTEIHWNELEAQFYVGGLLNGEFGTTKWMSNLSKHLSAIGRKGGQSRTPAKQAASAANGKKGGRPRVRKLA